MICAMTGEGTSSAICRRDETGQAVLAARERHDIGVEIDQMNLCAAVRIMTGVAGGYGEPA